MLLQIIDASEGNLTKLAVADEQGFGLGVGHEFIDACQGLYPGFGEPYLQLSRGSIEIVTSRLAPGFMIGQNNTIDELAKICNRYLQHVVFTDPNKRYILNFLGHDYEELIDRLSMGHEVVRKQLERF